MGLTDTAANTFADARTGKNIRQLLGGLLHQEADLADRTIAASRQLGTKLYGVLYGDPPWRVEPYSRETGMDRAADNHYPTMPLEKMT